MCETQQCVGRRTNVLLIINQFKRKILPLSPLPGVCFCASDIKFRSDHCNIFNFTCATQTIELESVGMNGKTPLIIAKIRFVSTMCVVFHFDVFKLKLKEKKNYFLMK